MQQSIRELIELVQKQHRELRILENLVATDSIKYIAGPIKNEMLRKLLELTGDVDDATRAVVKGVRTIKRARLKDEAAISNLVINLSTMGMSVDQLTTDSSKIEAEAAAAAASSPVPTA